MNKFIFLSFLLFSYTLYAQEISLENPKNTLETDLDGPKEFNPRKSHWLSTFGFEYTKYEIIPKEFAFEGVKRKFRTRDQELWGMRLGLGGEIYLGAGFMTSTMLETYYVGTMFHQRMNAGTDDDDVDIAFIKTTGQIVGGDISQSLGFMFDLKTKNPFMDEMTYLTIMPFVEAGVGKAWAYNRTHYSFNLSSTDEAYKLKVRDDLTNAKFGAGLNIMSKQGFFLILKATINNYDVEKRRIQGLVRPNGQNSTDIDETSRSTNIDPVTIYTLGGGYKF